MLAEFSPQGFTLKQNPSYWNKSTVKVPAIDFPFYSSNANLVPPIASGQIDWAGSNVGPGISSNYLSKSTDNHTWLDSQPYFAANNVVTLWFNVTKAPLNDPAVRQAISYGINRQQLSTQGETGYEPPATSSGGLLLPIDNSFLDPSLANDLPPTGDPAKVASILTKRRLHQDRRQVDQERPDRSRSRSPTRSPTPTTTPTPSSSRSQLNELGFNVTVDGIGSPDGLAGRLHQRQFRRHDPLEQPGPEPVLLLRELDGQHAHRRRSASRPPVTTAGSRTRPPRPRWTSSPGPTTRPPRRRPSPPCRRSCRPRCR